MPADWCPGCGLCACWCECWMGNRKFRDPRYDLWHDEYFQRTRGRLIDTVTPQEVYL